MAAARGLQGPRAGPKTGLHPNPMTNPTPTAAPSVTYHCEFLNEEERRQMYNKFYTLEWHQHIINMYGKKIPAPRKYAWMGVAPKVMYGEPLHITPWTDEAKFIQEKVKTVTGIEFDSLNINLYMNKDHYLGWHIDPEDEGLWKFPIASVTLGSERIFQMRRYRREEGKKGRQAYGEVCDMLLHHGSLLIMPPGFQAEWEHRLDKKKTACGPRINLTFRRIKP